jgi:hypothetical protein
MMRDRIAILVVAGGMAAGSVAATAPLQVALVENVTGNPAGVELMDYLEAGKIIELGPRDTIVVSYMNSIDPHAKPGNTPLLGRLLRFGS